MDSAFVTPRPSCASGCGLMFLAGGSGAMKLGGFGAGPFIDVPRGKSALSGGRGAGGFGAGALRLIGGCGGLSGGGRVS